MLTFSDLQNGDDFLLKGVKYRKTRPWAPQQFNASLMENTPDKPTFITIEANEIVKKYLR